MNLSNISDETTEKQNTTGVWSSILDIIPDDGTAIIIEGMVNRGDERGIPIFAKLYDQNGDELPDDTEVAIRYESPTMDDPVIVTEPYENIRAYNDLTVQNQQNEDYIDRVKHVFKNTERALANGGMPGLKIEDVDRAEVAIKGDTQVDWSQGSRLQIDSNAVREV